eukprot:UN01461
MLLKNKNKLVQNDASIAAANSTTSTAPTLVKNGGDMSKVQTIVTGEVQMHLLIACMKLVFKRPAEIQAMLGRLFNVLLSPDHSIGTGVEHILDLPTQQQAQVYYRMLASSITETSKLFLSKTQGIAHHFWEFEALHDETSVQSSYLLTEFNTLSTVYFIPQSAFTKLHKGHIYKDDEEEKEQPMEEEEEHVVVAQEIPNQNSNQQHEQQQPDLLGMSSSSIPQNNSSNNNTTTTTTAANNNLYKLSNGTR